VRGVKRGTVPSLRPAVLRTPHMRTTPPSCYWLLLYFRNRLLVALYARRVGDMIVFVVEVGCCSVIVFARCKLAGTEFQNLTIIHRYLSLPGAFAIQNSSFNTYVTLLFKSFNKGIKANALTDNTPITFNMVLVSTMAATASTSSASVALLKSPNS
jgi:hypothetical protein